mgnify:CR=1 FL=1
MKTQIVLKIVMVFNIKIEYFNWTLKENFKDHTIRKDYNFLIISFFKYMFWHGFNLKYPKLGYDSVKIGLVYILKYVSELSLDV